jgi:putative tryptophan/tyrosine transport system substrate-binding protein
MTVVRGGASVLREATKPKSMAKTILFCLAVTFWMTTSFSAGAQQSKKVSRLCYLGSSAPEAVKNLQPFHKRLRDLGYIDGQNVTFEYRYFEGKVERAPQLAAELVRIHCDIILTTGTEAALAAKGATQRIPIVMGFSGDAVQVGIVADLARPGGNVTGMTSLNNELSGKRLELLMEIIPKLARVALLWSPANPNTVRVVKETEAVARSLRVVIQKIEVKTAREFDGAFRMALNKQAEALMLAGGGLFGANQRQIVELATKNRLPATYPNMQFVEAGGLMAYTENRNYMFGRAAEYVDKILKGAKPADLPVERPNKWELVINLKTAKQIGLTIPPSVLARADRLIK